MNFDPVELLALPQNPVADFGRLFPGIMKNLRRACAQHPVRTIDPLRLLANERYPEYPSHCTVPLKLLGTNRVQALCCPAGVPGVKHITSWTTTGPKIALLGLSVSGLQILDRRFIDLHVAIGQNPGPDLLVIGVSHSAASPTHRAIV
jgi:hypothetical protein